MPAAARGEEPRSEKGKLLVTVRFQGRRGCRRAIKRAGAEERFCFRIHKRGKLGFQESASTLEREIGGAIWKALEQRHRTQPRVDLANPDVTIHADVLQGRTNAGDGASRPANSTPAA